MSTRIRLPTYVPVPYPEALQKFLNRIEDNAMTVKHGHPHAELMKQYAEDAAETDQPWERWETRNPVPGAPWADCCHHPLWVAEASYRRKPQTIRIGEHDVSAPLKHPPHSPTYYVPDLGGRSGSDFTRRVEWLGSVYDHIMLDSGLCHSTREAAHNHAKALVSFTKRR